MTAHRIPLPDWRDSLKGLPLAAISDEGIIHVSDVLPLMKSKFALADDGDLDAMEAVESMSERRQIAMPKGRKD